MVALRIGLYTLMKSFTCILYFVRYARDVECVPLGHWRLARPSPLETTKLAFILILPKRTSSQKSETRLWTALTQGASPTTMDKLPMILLRWNNIRGGLSQHVPRAIV